MNRQLERIHIPAFVIVANKDRLTKPVASEYMTEHLPKAALFTVAPTKHQGACRKT